MDDRRAEGDLLFHAGGIGTDALVEVSVSPKKNAKSCPISLFVFAAP